MNVNGIKFIQNLKDPNLYLLRYRKNIHSQFGEDGILEYIFSHMPTDKKKWSVEFGAWDGIFASNTCHLIEKKGWHGIYIESDKVRFKDLIANYGNNNRVYCINKFVELAGRNSLDNILSKVDDLPDNFDLLSVDIDSCDYHVWDSINKYYPKVVVIEFNPSMPLDFDYVQEKKFNLNNGSSLVALNNLAKNKGYALVCCTDANAIFVQKKYFKLFKIKDNSVETMYRPFRNIYQTSLWQGYDGTIHLLGCNQLLWHNVIINENKLQVLPKFLRFFPGTTNPLIQAFKKLYYKFPFIVKTINFVISGRLVYAGNKNTNQ